MGMHYCDCIIIAARRWGHSYTKLRTRLVGEQKIVGLVLSTSG